MSPAGAQEAGSHLYDRWQGSISAAAISIGSTIRVDTDDAEGTELDVEDDLGLERGAVRPRFGVRWRPSRRHQLEAAYLLVTRTGDRTSDRQIVIDSVTFVDGGELESRVRTDQLAIIYRYAMRATDRTLLGFSGGFGFLFLNSRTSGSGFTPSGGETRPITIETSPNIPSLTLGGFGQFRIGDRWYAESDLRALYLPVDNIDVFILEASGAVRYYPLSWLGLDAGVSLSRQAVDVEQKDDALIDIGFLGKVRYGAQYLRVGALVTF